MTLGQNLQAARKAKGLSQETLAEQIGVSRQALGKWEKDTALPGLDNLQAAAQVLGVPVSTTSWGVEENDVNEKFTSQLPDTPLTWPDSVNCQRSEENVTSGAPIALPGYCAIHRLQERLLKTGLVRYFSHQVLFA